MEFKLRISTWGKETGLQLGKIIDNINRIIAEKDCIFYEINYKPSVIIDIIDLFMIANTTLYANRL